MALIKCKECKQEVSNTAKTCPQCGVKNPATTAKDYLAGIGILLIIIFFISQCSFSDEKTDNSKKEVEVLTPEELRAKDIKRQFSPWDGSHRNLEKIIKTSMNDPKSYEHDDTAYWDRGDHLIVQTTFRGKNGYGAIVKSTVKAKVSLSGEILEILEQY